MDASGLAINSVTTSQQNNMANQIDGWSYRAAGIGVPALAMVALGTARRGIRRLAQPPAFCSASGPASAPAT